MTRVKNTIEKRSFRVIIKAGDRMCCRFYVPERDHEEYEEIVSAVKNPGQLSLFGEMHPADTSAVLANGRDRQPAPFAMKWGYTEFGKLIFNTRSETAAEKQLFRDGILNRRCLIPALYYFEWDKEKTKYRIGADDRSLIWLAGIYRFEDKTPVFSVLTREPVGALRDIHSRMPVIIPKNRTEEWLCDPEQTVSLIGGSRTDLRAEVCEK